MEQQGEKVQRLEMLKKVSLARLAAIHKRLKAAVGNLFVGEYHVNHHETNQRSGQRVQQLFSRYTEVISFRFLGSCKELRWAEPCKSSLPPCLRKVVVENPLSRGGHTHTHTFKGT